MTCQISAVAQNAPTRITPAVAVAEALLATAVFAETKKLPACPTHPLYQLFPDFVQQLKSLAG